MVKAPASGRRVLWAANSYWDSPFQVGANHYARELARRGWQVAFVSEPISPLHFLPRAGRKEALERFATWRRGGIEDVHGRVFAYTPMALLPPHAAPGLRGRRLLAHWHRATVPDLRRKIVGRGFAAVDLLVVDTVRQAFWLDAVRAGVTAARVTDHLAGFASVTPAMLAGERALIRAVDHVFYTARTLEPHVRESGAKAATWLPNGVDLAAFSRDAGGPPAEYGDIPHPRAVYVGAIDRWFDVALVERVARALPDLALVLIGPEKADLSSLRRLPNVHVLGARPHPAVPAYLQHADLGLIPFRRDALVNSVSPIKLYEYAAAGLPVVATRWDELAALEPPARLCETADDFVEGVRQSLADPTPAAQLRAFAERADWSDRTQRMLEVLGFD